MDDERIRQLTSEVLSQVRGGHGTDLAALEARVAALERTVARLVGEAAEGAAAAPAPIPVPAGVLRRAPAALALSLPAVPAETPVLVSTHPSLEVLKVAPGAEICRLEPGRSCSLCHRCRAYGY